MTATPTPVRTLGVEEEFLLVHPADGTPVPCAGRVLERAEQDRAADDRTVYKPELLTSQVEGASGVCTGLAELGAQLAHGRRALAGAAHAGGALLLPSATPPLSTGRVPATRGERFEQITALYADVVADYQVCGCHVHVGIPDRDTAVAVVNHLRPWLPTLLALSVNSPYRYGRDTGYASRRMLEQRAFPGSGVPPVFTSAAAQEAEVARLVDCGVLADPQMTFWLARPSLRFPTVEFRTADAAATVDEALLQAALSRALVHTALDDLTAGREADRRTDGEHAVGEQVAAAAVWSAARYGLRGPAVDPWRGLLVPATSMVRSLLRRTRPALESAGDLGLVQVVLARLAAVGTGAERQRAAGPDDPAAAVRALAADALRPAAGAPAPADDHDTDPSAPAPVGARGEEHPP
ncbi:glutamate--cysteine ligase [Streptomyces sp. DSM 42041]|uniref:Putative glutamate--cysteine ligase 2 n=1 Tax=Streptomyces hazeniae TaxID=3075538 RepID=A0ABU2NXY3_9ACTN|nr:glutamate--cysteine ligase [Streptomyces sp. DSM 42041]MDT0381550.1 glutamate--cysteine ligase [Streptomyces sp. DSM 42041]